MNVAINIFDAMAVLQAPATHLSGLESPIARHLEATASRDFRFLLISTAVVAVGIVFEGPEVFAEFKAWRNSGDGRSRSTVGPRQARSLVPLWSLIGFLLVIAGVSLEGVFEGLAGGDDDKIRNFDRGVIADSEYKASLLDAEAAQQRARAAKDEKDLAELRKASMPRFIDEDRLASKMRKYSGTPIDFFALKDFEPLQLTRVIRDALLVRARWKTGAAVNIAWSDPGDPVPEEFARVGVWVEKPPASARLDRIAEALVKELQAEGLDAYTRPGKKENPFLGIPDIAIRVYVSLKPFPGMPEDLRVVSAHK